MISGIVVEGMNEHRHAQAGPAEGVGHAAFVAEVRQRDEDAVNLAGLLLEQVGAFLRVFHGFDRAEPGCADRQGDRADAKFFEQGENFLASGVTEMGGEETAVADDNSESNHNVGLFVRCRVHIINPPGARQHFIKAKKGCMPGNFSITLSAGKEIQRKGKNGASNHGSRKGAAICR